MSYWEVRELDELYNRINGVAERDLARQYKRVAKKIIEDLLKLYQEIQNDNVNGRGYVLQSDLYRYDKYYDTLSEINKQLQALGEAEIKITDSALKNMYVDNAKRINKLMAFSTSVDKAQVSEAINAIWCADGKNWSARIWENKSALEETLRQGIVDCIARGASSDELKRELMTRFNVGFAQADRIARTELAYVQNKSTLDAYSANGIEYFRFKATSDTKCCDECEEMDGKIIKVSEARIGENVGPLHPHCRCCVIAVRKGGN